MDTLLDAWYQRTVQTLGCQQRVSFKKAKAVPSNGKVMETGFWDSQGIIFVDYLENLKTIIGAHLHNYWKACCKNNFLDWSTGTLFISAQLWLVN